MTHRHTEHAHAKEKHQNRAHASYRSERACWCLERKILKRISRARWRHAETWHRNPGILDSLASGAENPTTLATSWKETKSGKTRKICIITFLELAPGNKTLVWTSVPSVGTVGSKISYHAFSFEIMVVVGFKMDLSWFRICSNIARVWLKKIFGHLEHSTPPPGNL